YCDRKSSGRQTIAAPFFAASRMKSIARAKFFSGSLPHFIWMSAMRVFSVLDILEITAEDAEFAVILIASNFSALSAVENHFTESAETMSIFSIVTRLVGLLFSPMLL